MKTFVIKTLAYCLFVVVTSMTYPNKLADMTSNQSIAHFKKIASYNTWANQQIVNWLLLADSNQWNMNIESSFSTLELTTRHLWNAEHGWLATLKNEPWSMAIETATKISKTDLLNGFITTSARFQDYVDSLKEADLNDSREVGKTQQKIMVSDIIQHVYNHTTYHRGQLITMGRQAGLPNPPRTDYIYFMMR
jgi:uncharacterized damage-inducible protein DinB